MINKTIFSILLVVLFLCTPALSLAQVATDTAPIIEQSTTTQNGTLYPFEDYEITSGTPKLYISLGETPVATNIGTTTTYLHTDHLGGTTLTTNQSGAVTKTLDYYPYGETRIDSGTNTEKTQYIGETYDQSTGLNYLNARYLNAKQGRFMSQDPVFFEIGQSEDGKKVLRDPQAMNSYSYALNNPIVNKDPTGRYFETAFDAVMFTNSLNEYRQNPSIANSLGVAFDGVSTAAPIFPAVGGVMMRTGVKSYSEYSPQVLGRAGEMASGVVTGAKEVFFVNGRTRIPDGVSRSLGYVAEVKNVAYQGFTRQIKDSIQIAKNEGLQFQLYVRESTRLSKPLQQAISNGQIQLRSMSDRTIKDTLRRITRNK